MSNKKAQFKPVDFSKGRKKIFEIILTVIKIIVLILLALLVAAFTVFPAIATGDPSKIIEPITKAKGLFFKDQ